MNLFLLAAGEGTRLRPHTLKTPKPAIPFLNVPLAYYSLALVRNFKLTNAVVNTFHLPVQVQDLFSPAKLSQVGFETVFQFSFEGEKIRGNGGGIAYAKKLFLDTDILMMNSDEVILPNESNIIEHAYEYHKNENNLATLIAMEHPEAGKKFGALWVDQWQNVHGFGKTPPNGNMKLKPLHFIGVQFLTPGIFEYLPSDGSESNIFYDNLIKAIAAGKKIKAYNISCDWYETGNQVDYLFATKMCLDKLKHNHSYLNMVLDNYAGEKTELIEGRILKAKSALVSSSHIQGFAVVGPEVDVSHNIYVENSVIYSQPQSLNIQNTLIL